MPRKAGDRCGVYRLVEPIGVGGMGEVWRAQHEMLGRAAAVKLIRMGATDHRGCRDAFVREARATAALECPHTVKLFDFGITDEGAFYYAMELLEGTALDQLLASFGAMPSARAVFVLRQICESIGEAHHIGLLHRDIKPSNVFLARVGREYDFAKVLDFGLVQHRSKLDNGGPVGTLPFMAPELLKGAPCTVATDIWAIGCVAYSMVAGRMPFFALEENALVAAILSKRPALPPDVNPTFARIILRCLEKEPRWRPESTEELALQLSRCGLDEVWSAKRAAAWWRQNMPLAEKEAPNLDEELPAHAGARRPPPLLTGRGDDLEKVRQSLAQLDPLLPLAPSLAPPLARLLLDRIDSGDPQIQVARDLLCEAGPRFAAAVPTLAEALAAPFWAKAATAASALASIGPMASAAVGKLIEALSHGDYAVRRQAAGALGKIGADAGRVVPALIDRLKRDDDHRVLEACAYALGEFGDDAASALPQLLRLLHIPEVAAGVAFALCHISSFPADCVTQLTAALRHDIWSARLAAARGLGLIGNAARVAVPSLEAAFADPDPSVRNRVAWSLGQIGDARAVPALVLRLADPEAKVRAEAAAALAEMGPSAREAGTALARATRDGDPSVQRAAAYALRQIAADGDEQYHERRRAIAREGGGIDPSDDEAIVRILDDLGHGGEPRLEWLSGAKDLLLEAWYKATRIEALVELLVVGSEIGVFATDGDQRIMRQDGSVARWLFRLRYDGRYYRMDFAREDGPAGVRRCFPDFPGTKEWHAAYLRARGQLPVLARLSADLHHKRTARLDEYSAAEVQAAWTSCRDPLLMMELVRRLCPPDLSERTARMLPPWTHGCRGPTALAGGPEQRRWEDEASRAIRSMVPGLPAPMCTASSDESA